MNVLQTTTIYRLSSYLVDIYLSDLGLQLVYRLF